MADNSSTKARRCDKKCSNCDTKQPVARRKCVNCSSPFPKIKKDLEKLKQKKMTNITQQRKLMEGRADILHMHHSCDVVIMMHHKHGNGDTLTFYGTEGAGVSFIGNKADIKTSESGKMALMLFQKFMEDLKLKNKQKPVTQDPIEGSEPTPLNGQTVPSISPEVLHNPVSSSATPPAQPITMLSSATPPSQPITVLSSATPPSQPNLTVSSSATPPPQSVIVSLSAASPPKPSTVSSSAAPPEQPNSAVSSSAAPPVQPNSAAQPPLQPSIGADVRDIVAYQVGGRVLACGQVQRGRNKIHGCSIPSSHVCVLITKTLQNVAAPLVLGDISENSYLENGQFFALPLLHLKTARLMSNSSLELRPFI